MLPDSLRYFKTLGMHESPSNIPAYLCVSYFHLRTRHLSIRALIKYVNFPSHAHARRAAPHNILDSINSLDLFDCITFIRFDRPLFSLLLACYPPPPSYAHIFAIYDETQNFPSCLRVSSLKRKRRR